MKKKMFVQITIIGIVFLVIFGIYRATNKEELEPFIASLDYIDILEPSKEYVIESDSIQYEIIYMKDKIGEELTSAMVELNGFEADKDITEKYKNLYVLSLSNISIDENLNKDGTCSISVNTKKIKSSGSHFNVRKIIMEISEPSKHRVTENGDIRFEIRYYGDIANIGLSGKSVVLYGFTANRQLFEKDDSTIVISLTNIVLNENNTTHSCSIAVTGGTAISSEGELTNNVKSESFYVISIIKKIELWINHNAVFSLFLAIISIIAIILGSLASFLDIKSYMDSKRIK